MVKNKGTMDEKHELKFERLQELVGKAVLGKHMMEMKSSFDFSGMVEIRMGLAWKPVYATIKGHFVYIWTSQEHTGELHQVFPLPKAKVDMVARDATRPHCCRITRGQLMLVLACKDESAANVWHAVLETSANSRHAKKALRKAIGEAARNEREKNARKGEYVSAGSWQLDMVSEEMEQRKSPCVIL
eukprot:TRINITY_DN28665_c0_g1_i1.p1 TRINITY_DN28665_c0_g1~~TRINITY_DN28665_c0_g1_i1.p1  ORF type:complete len:187 (+),score=68.06 TRINITY_DN28665_c0_g1_i1:144-704(+)